MEPEALRQAVRDLLRQVPTMTLATCRDGQPWATDVYFAPFAGGLVFFSAPDSRHCLNLAANPACAATVHAPSSGWKDIRGVQMEGRAAPLEGLADLARATALYLAKFPFAEELLKNPARSGGKLLKARPHLFMPARTRYLDNAQGIGTRFELAAPTRG